MLHLLCPSTLEKVYQDLLDQRHDALETWRDSKDPFYQRQFHQINRYLDETKAAYLENMGENIELVLAAKGKGNK